MSTRPPDTRVVYGANCTWWGSIREIGKTRPGLSGHSLPCCPHCGGVLFEIDCEDDWWALARKYEAAGHPGYVEMLRWARGKCFRGMAALESAYESRGRDE